MMNSLMPILVTGIITYGVYALFELFVRRSERMAIIEKFSLGVDPDNFKHQIKLFSKKEGSAWAIRIGCLLLGVGLGTLIVSIVELSTSMFSDWNELMRNATDTMYPASAALFGGIGLVIAYCIERKHKREEKEEE